jgi:CTP synthase (UTP-ammonia lyase)
MRIGIVGDYNPAHESHPATTQAAFLAARAIGLQADIVWISTANVSDETLAKTDAIWAAPASPYRSADGMLHAIRYAREKQRPFLGTCGGFQYALIEFARNVMDVGNADTAENNTPGALNIITPVVCASEQRKDGDPKLVGRNVLTVLPNTKLAEYMKAGEHREALFCNFEPNAEFLPRLPEAGLITNALGPQGELRGVELAPPSEHPFFIATLFQPQLTSKATGRPHPLLIAFIHAASSYHAQARKKARKASS